ncbi:MAG: MBL fold metallo-hydrolase [Lachnospiraceae bacterium]|nr:MBL fold metallo-hydrolase [Lachnospiraceae bacterium]
MKINSTVVGRVSANCYFLVNEETGETVVIDPGGEFGRLSAKITELGLKPVAILYTHGHFDHVEAGAELAQKYAVKRYVHSLDMPVLQNPEMNVSWMVGDEEVFDADETFGDGDILSLAGFEIKCIHTPGHTPGGACFYLEKEDTLFSGDTLFCESVGRTDFPGGSSGQLIKSIREKLMTLPDLTVVYTGHGEPTKIGYEKANNPYL